ncbi:ATP-binding protein [Methanosarcinales archaeon]|nr:MAG: ATP-binding protein [Methanosarcinales archaeon]
MSEEEHRAAGEAHAEGTESHEEAVRKSMEHVKHKVMVISGKGGVGKTTVAVNLAFALSMRGLDVGLMDADIHGPDVPKMLGIEDRRPEVIDGRVNPVHATPRLKTISIAYFLPDRNAAVIWRGPLKMHAIRQFLSDVNWGELDYLVIDLPPGTGDEPLSVAQLIKNVDGAVIVTTPQEMSLLDVRKAVKFSQVLGIPVIGIVENMSGMICPHCGKEINIFKKGGGERAAREMGVPFLGSVPFDTRVVEDADAGVPFMLRNTNVKDSFEKIVEKIRNFVERRQTTQTT